MQQNFVRNGFSNESFCHCMCQDFLKNSFSDELFCHYMYPKIVLVTKLFVTKYDLINYSVFSDEIFSSLNSVFNEKNIQQRNIFVAKSFFFFLTNRTFSYEIFHRQDFQRQGFSDEMSFVTNQQISSLKVLGDEKLDFQ